MLLSKQAVVKAAMSGAETSLALVDGGSDDDQLTDSGNGFITAGFAPNDVLFLKGATTAANDTAITGVQIKNVEAGVIYLPTGTIDTAEPLPDTAILAVASGGSLRDIMKDGKIQFYSGTQASSPDNSPNGTLLAEFTRNGGAWAAGAFDNGLEFGAAVNAVLGILAGETWQATGLAAAGSSGTAASSFRFVGNEADGGGSSTDLPRIDGSIGTSGTDFVVSSSVIVAGNTYTIDQFNLTLPMQYGA